MHNGGWLVLDSTPESSASAADDDSWLASLEDLSDYVSQLWNSYIIGLNPDRQRQAIYMPLAEGGSLIKSVWSSIQESAESLARRIGHFWGRNGSVDDIHAPAWPLFLFLASLATAAIGTFMPFRRWYRRQIQKRRGGARRRLRVAPKWLSIADSKPFWRGAGSCAVSARRSANWRKSRLPNGARRRRAARRGNRLGASSMHFIACGLAAWPWTAGKRPQ